MKNLLKKLFKIYFYRKNHNFFYDKYIGGSFNNLEKSNYFTFYYGWS